MRVVLMLRCAVAGDEQFADVVRNADELTRLLRVRAHTLIVCVY
jgi:aspartokinase-like uncharacterized kinase